MLNEEPNINNERNKSKWRKTFRVIKIKQTGDFSKTKRFLKNISDNDFRKILAKYGQIGCEELRRHTPVDSGKTADSWSYSIEKTSRGSRIVWSNSNVNDGVNIAIILQYGHVTNGGGYVQGQDYINPALKETFDNIAKEAWEEVTRL